MRTKPSWRGSGHDSATAEPHTPPARHDQEPCSKEARGSRASPHESSHTGSRYSADSCWWDSSFSCCSPSVDRWTICCFQRAKQACGCVSSFSGSRYIAIGKPTRTPPIPVKTSEMFLQEPCHQRCVTRSRELVMTRARQQAQPPKPAPDRRRGGRDHLSSRCGTGPTTGPSARHWSHIHVRPADAPCV